MKLITNLANRYRYQMNDSVRCSLKSSPISVPGGLAPAPTGISLRHTLTGKENGGHVLYGDGNVNRWDEGGEAFSSIDDNGVEVVRSQMIPFVVNGVNVWPLDASIVSLWWHTHPNVSIDGAQMGSSIPSDADYEVQRALHDTGYKGNSFVVGVGDWLCNIF